MELYLRHVIRGCSLGLWHSEDRSCLYSRWCQEWYLLYDVHTKQADLIDEPTLENKLIDLKTAQLLQFCYTGRLDLMKALPK